MTINQLPSNPPPRQLVAHATGARLTSYLSVALVILVMVACATSTLQQRQHNQHEQRLLFQSSSSSPVSRQHYLTLKRSPSTSTYENFGPVYDRPQIYSNAFAQSNSFNQDSAEPDEVQDFEANDDEFLHQLKETARYLDKKLADRQRQQQNQLATFNEATDLGQQQSLESNGQLLQQAYGYQGPVYSMIDERRPIDSQAQFSAGWQTLNDGDLDVSSDEQDAGNENDAVVVPPPPHLDNSQPISSLSDQVSAYKLFGQQLQQQQQQHSITDDKYKQLLKSLLLDHVQANSLAGSSTNENQKRDSTSDEAAKLVDDRTKTTDQQQQQPDETSGAATKSTAKFTTLLEDEPDNGPASLSPLKGNDNGGVVASNEAPSSGVTYGKLVYDQANQRLAVANNTNNSSGGSIFGRLYSNMAHYLPFLSQLTSLRNGGNVDNSTVTSNSDTSKPNSMIAESKQDGPVTVATGNNDETSGQAAQSGDSELHANRNVSVSLALNKSKLNDQTTTSESGQRTMLENNGEINHNTQRDNDEGDDANQDNQQTQTDDKQQQKISDVKVTIDRKKTNDDEDNNNSDNLDQDFTGQFANGNGIRPIEAKADANNKRQQQGKKSAGSKRDQAQKFVFENGGNNYNNPVEPDMDMSQMVPTSIGSGQRGYKRNDDDDDQDDNNNNNVDFDQHHENRYNMMRHSNLMVPIGSASDVLVRTTSGGSTKEPESLLGKYIYAPTQHYYLNSMMPPAVGHHVLAANGGHIQPGHEMYNSYGTDMPMKGAYAYQKDHGSIVDKSNDLYFLVMVGAFCVMAMTVVLAAGLFAYRIQQNRKSSQDTGYPTYGVVGPNNMSAKCGAASFVGGYFTGPPSGSSKSGSVKHLPDLYGTPNGAGGSDSGLNSLDKSSSNKKASSVSSLNEHHQSASSRAASSNFMTAASQDAARMYHYQHQKQQMIISDRNSGGRATSASDLDSEDENDDGSYTVYECPGLASAHEMEIKNPLFNDDQSP